MTPVNPPVARAGLLPVGLYLVAALLLAQGVAHASYVGGVAAPTGSLRWRFGFMGIVFLNVVYPLLGLALGALTAALTRQRAMLLVFAALSGLAALLALGGFAFFLLDAVQIWATVPEQLRGNYAITVSQTSLVAGLAIALLLALTVAVVQGFRREGTHRRRPPTDRRGLVVGRS